MKPVHLSLHEDLLGLQLVVQILLLDQFQLQLLGLLDGPLLLGGPPLLALLQLLGLSLQVYQPLLSVKHSLFSSQVG